MAVCPSGHRSFYSLDLLLADPYAIRVRCRGDGCEELAVFVQPLKLSTS